MHEEAPQVNTIVYDEARHANTNSVHDITESGHVLGSFAYTSREIHMLKQCHVEPPLVPSDKDISRVDKAICESTLVHAEGLPYSENRRSKRK